MRCTRQNPEDAISSTSKYFLAVCESKSHFHAISLDVFGRYFLVTSAVTSEVVVSNVPYTRNTIRNTHSSTANLDNGSIENTLGCLNRWS